MGGQEFVVLTDLSGRKSIIFIGVPISDIFEHLTSTISEATPLYELCARVLE
jgi:hypothetical protein